MLTLLSSLLGFGTSFMPKIFSFFEEKQNHKYEMERMRLSAELADKQHRMDMVALNANADIEQAKALYRHDAAIGKNAPVWVDAIRAMVRPILTFGTLGLYGGLLAFSGAEMLASTAFAGLEAMVAAIWSFWFGNRAMQKKLY